MARRNSFSSKKQFRIHQNTMKNDRRLSIVKRKRWPHAGYISGDGRLEGQSLLHTGKYIQFPRNSRRRRWLKRQSNKKIRRCSTVASRGKGYRRLFDYWWTLY